MALERPQQKSNIMSFTSVAWFGVRKIEKNVCECVYIIAAAASLSYSSLW